MQVNTQADEGGWVAGKVMSPMKVDFPFKFKSESALPFMLRKGARPYDSPLTLTPRGC